MSVNLLRKEQCPFNRVCFLFNIGGINKMIFSALIFISGFLLMFVTVFKINFFWNNKHIHEFRNKIGDTGAGFLFLTLSFLCIYYGAHFLYQSF